jgi:hypothetical protein
MQSQTGGGIMQMMEVKEKAERLGLKPGKMGKADLIHTIQSKEGYLPCFQTGLDSCNQLDCCWRSDCLSRSTTGKKVESKREIYLKKVTDELKEFNDRIDGLKVKAKTMVGKRKTEALQEIKRLEKKCEEEIKLKIHELAQAGEDIWQPTKKRIDCSWKDLRKALKETLSKVGSMKN